MHPHRVHRPALHPLARLLQDGTSGVGRHRARREPPAGVCARLFNGGHRKSERFSTPDTARSLPIYKQRSFQESSAEAIEEADN